MLYSTVCLGWNLNFIMLLHILILLIYISMYAQCIYIPAYIYTWTDRYIISVMIVFEDHCLIWFVAERLLLFYTIQMWLPRSASAKKKIPLCRVWMNRAEELVQSLIFWNQTLNCHFWFISLQHFLVFEIKLNVTKIWPESWFCVLMDLGLWSWLMPIVCPCTRDL